jgi:RNA polymerase sigma factor (sigma-70 family)
MYIPTIKKHYEDNHRRLVKKMSFRAGAPQDGEDVVQEAYYRAIKYQRSFDGSNFDRWFNTILNNALREHKNNQKGYSTQESEENEEESVQCTFYPSKVMAEVYSMIERRPAIQAEVLMLYFHQEYTARDISKILPHSYAQIHQIIQRFRNELKDTYRE